MVEPEPSGTSTQRSESVVPLNDHVRDSPLQEALRAASSITQKPAGRKGGRRLLHRQSALAKLLQRGAEVARINGDGLKLGLKKEQEGAQNNYDGPEQDSKEEQEAKQNGGGHLYGKLKAEQNIRSTLTGRWSQEKRNGPLYKHPKIDGSTVTKDLNVLSSAFEKDTESEKPEKSLTMNDHEPNSTLLELSTDDTNSPTKSKDTDNVTLTSLLKSIPMNIRSVAPRAELPVSVL